MFVGVCRSDFDLTKSPGNGDLDVEFWGYHTASGERFTPEEKNVDYADVITPGDTVGCLLEFRKGYATLKFYLNGVSFFFV